MRRADGTFVHSDALSDCGFRRVRRIVAVPPEARELQQDIHVDGIKTQRVLLLQNYRGQHRPTGFHQRAGPLFFMRLRRSVCSAFVTAIL